MIARVAPQLTALLLWVFSAVCLFGCGSRDDGGSSGPGGRGQPSVRAPVKVAAVKRAGVQRWIRLTGTIRPVRESRVSAKVAGRVAEIFVDEGDAVAEGDPLFRLQLRDFALAKEQAKHGLDAAKARLNAAGVKVANARREYERLRALRANNAVSQQKLDAASDAYKTSKAALMVAAASVDVASDALEMARHNFMEATVRSPISGHVASRNVNVGEMVSPISPVPCFYIVDDSICKVEAQLPDTLQSSVRISQEVRITVDGVPGREWRGKITYMGHTIDPLSRTLAIRTRLENREMLLRPGALARLRILSDEREDVTTVPIRSIVKRNGEPMVFVVKSGIALARRVELGLGGEDNVEVTHGVRPGDLVVMDGTESLEDGIAVEILNPGEVGLNDEPAGAVRQP